MRPSTIIRVLSTITFSTLAASTLSAKRSAIDGNHEGMATWEKFQPGSGECHLSTADYIVTISKELFNYGLCGKWMDIGTPNGEALAYGRVGGICKRCSKEDIIMSKSMYTNLADLSDFEIEVIWYFPEGGASR